MTPRFRSAFAAPSGFVAAVTPAKPANGTAGARVLVASPASLHSTVSAAASPASASKLAA